MIMRANARNANQIEVHGILIEIKHRVRVPLAKPTELQRPPDEKEEDKDQKTPPTQNNSL